MTEQRKGLPHTAYEVIDGHEYKPYIPAEEKIPEFTFKAIFLGIILSIIFGMAMAYVGLKIGMTVSASIPAAVISMGILRGILRKGTILENNVVQTITASGEGLAAGVIFTIPAVYIWGYSLADFGLWKIVGISVIGGILGVLMMIPLRPYLIVAEHGKLKYPEGTACAEVLVAGDTGGTHAQYVLWGVIIGSIYKFLSGTLKLWQEIAAWNLSKIRNIPIMKNLVFSMEASPILLGVGYIIGIEIAAFMLAGGLLAWFVIIPLISYCGDGLTTLLPPILQGKTKLISQMTADEIWGNYIRFIGAGAVAFGGLISLCKAFPTILGSFKAAAGKMLGRFTKKMEETKRTFLDISMGWIITITLILLVVISFYPGIHVSWIGSILILVFGFFFVTVSSRLVGLIGSSSNPVSGMTIGTLIATSLILLALKYTGSEGMLAALIIGTFVCIAMCLAGDISQDLKTGFLVGSTPKALQIGQIIGAIASSIFIAWTVMYLQKNIGIGIPVHPGIKPLVAPQATMMSMVIEGIFKGSLPWSLVIMGGFIAVIVEILGVPALPFAVGLYLPLELSTPVMAGGIIAAMVSKRFKGETLKRKIEKGVLISSGLIAGDALMGLLVVGLEAKGIHLNIKWMGAENPWVAVIAFFIICLYLWLYINKGEEE